MLKLKSILLGGLAVGAIVTLIARIPVVGNWISCFTYILAGLVAVWHYTSENELTIRPGTGVGIGLGAGIMAAVVVAALTQLAMTAGVIPTYEQMMEMQLEKQNLTPEQEEQSRAMMGQPWFIVVAIATSVIASAVMGAVGGAIGASVFKRGGALKDEESDIL